MTVELLGISFNVFEFFIIPFFILILPKLFLNKCKVKNKKLLKWYLGAVLLFLSSILISCYNAIDSVAVLKCFLKWSEIFGLSAIIFLYCSSYKKFKFIWWLLIIIYITDILIPIIMSLWIISSIDYNVLRQLPAYNMLFLLSLIFPYSKRYRFVFFTSTILGCLILMSLTRGAWIGLAFLVIYCFFRFRYLLKRIILAIVISIFFLGITYNANSEIKYSVNNKIQHAFNLNSASNLQRFSMANLAFKLFLEHPVTGIGAENFSNYLIKKEIPAFIFVDKIENFTPHNFFLQIAAENGIIGLLSMCGLLLVVYKILFKYTSFNSKYYYLNSMKLFYIVMIISFIFGYVAGGTRIQLGLYLGLVLGTLRFFSKDSIK